MIYELGVEESPRVPQRRVQPQPQAGQGRDYANVQEVLADDGAVGRDPTRGEVGSGRGMW